MNETEQVTSRRIHQEFAVVDLFCGIGGLTRGFIDEGFHVSAGVDFDESCKHAYEVNNRTEFFHKDVTKLTTDELTRYYPEDKRKILIGCAPCQPFSIFNKRDDNRLFRESDDKWKLLYSFASLIEVLRPEVVSMENVPLLVNYNKGRVYKDFLSKLKALDYYVHAGIYDAKDYGVPQRRKRLIMLASVHKPLEMIARTHKQGTYKTVCEAIGHLPPISDGEVCGKDSLHRSRKLTDINKARLLATKEGGSWRDWDESLVLACHKKAGGKLYNSPYGRMFWNDVAPTMTTYCIGINNGRFGHPSQHRAISLREAALLQSFPEDYNFINPDVVFSTAAIAKHIGNAVPVKLSNAIAKSIKKHLLSI